MVFFFFFQAEDGIRDYDVTEFRRVLFRSVTFSSDGITWAPLQEIPVGEQHWYWRPVWHDGVCYCITYKIASKTRRAMSLFSSEDGRDYRIVNLQLYSTMLPSEAAMVFLEDDRAICVVRRDGGDKKAVIGKARPPYTDWTWKDLDRSIAGPCLQQLADRRIIVSGRFPEQIGRASCRERV